MLLSTASSKSEPNKRADLERQSSKDSVVSRQEPKKKKRGRIIRIPTQLLPSAESDDHDSLGLIPFSMDQCFLCSRLLSSHSGDSTNMRRGTQASDGDLIGSKA